MYLVVKTLADSRAIRPGHCEVAYDQAFRCCCLYFCESTPRGTSEKARTDHIQGFSGQVERIGEDVNVFVDDGL